MREKVQMLLARLEEIHASGSGEISVSEVFEVIGQPDDPRLREDLLARGSLEICRQNGDMRFCNEGRAFKTPLGPGTLHVPCLLGGRVVRQGDGFSLEFDQDKTMVGKALFVELKLQRLEVSPRHVAVRLPGGVFDQEYAL